MSDIDEASSLLFDLTKKKKKKLGTFLPQPVSPPSSQIMDDTTEYDYDFLLSRVYELMRQQNVDITVQTKFSMVPLQVVPEGKKKTVFINFYEICRKLHREPSHVQEYILSELVTTGSIDAKNNFILNGRYSVNHLEHIIKKYVWDYVLCRGCHGSTTSLSKDKGLLVLQCEVCQAFRTVLPIQKGYLAQVGVHKKKH
jgi:translation initiation factor 2 subunit 2